MRDALKTCLTVAGGLAEVPRHRALSAARALVAQSGARAGLVTSLAEDLVQQGRSNREAVAALVKFEVARGLGRVGLAGADEVAELSARVRALEAAVRELTARLPAPDDTARRP